MIKRTEILVLIFLFFISTTGLPVFYHYCTMMGENSLSECEMCSIEVKKDSSCCSEKVYENVQQISSNKSRCCVDQFDYKKIEDEFFQNFNPNVKHFYLVVVTVNSSTLLLDEVETNLQQDDHNLPPPKFGKQLLHTIHQLKIDIPIC